jgi:hypothetical protein
MGETISGQNSKHDADVDEYSSSTWELVQSRVLQRSLESKEKYKVPLNHVDDPDDILSENAFQNPFSVKYFVTWNIELDVNERLRQERDSRATPSFTGQFRLSLVSCHHLH